MGIIPYASVLSRMKKSRKITALLLVLAAVGGLIISAPTARAAVGSMTLAELQAALPTGKYWNHTVDYDTYNKNREYYNLTCTDTPCNHGSGHSCGPYYDGRCGCNSYGSSTQCMGFARFLCYELFGSMPAGNGITESALWKATTVDNLKPGDYIRDTRSYGHSVVVASVDKEKQTVTVAECNYNGSCRISWNRTISFSELKSSSEVHCLSAGGVPTSFSVTFNTAGGECSTLLENVAAGSSCMLPFPKKTGCCFDGWYTANTGGTRVGAAGDRYTPAADVTLYAHWVLLGDLNRSGILDGKDISVMFQWWNGKNELGSDALKFSDFNGDGTTDLRDAAAMYVFWSKR